MSSKGLLRVVEDARAGDPYAFAHLYREFAKPVYYLALKMTTAESNAMSITQGVMRRFFGSLPEARTVDDLREYFSRITYNACLDLLRERKILTLCKQAPFEAAKLEDCPEEFIPQSFAGDARRRKEVMGIVEQLGATQKSVLVLYYYHGMDTKLIGETLGMEESSARNRLLHAHTKLRSQLSEVAKNAAPIHPTAVPVLTQIMRQDAQEAFSPRISSAIWRSVGGAMKLPTDAIMGGMAVQIQSAGSVPCARGNGAMVAKAQGMRHTRTAATVGGIAIVCCLVAALLNIGGIFAVWSKDVIIEDSQTPLTSVYDGFLGGTEDVKVVQVSRRISQPYITAERVILSYPSGTLVTGEQMISDAGVVATNAAGEPVELVVDGLRKVDFTVKGCYEVTVYPPDLPAMEMEITLEIE